MGSIAQSRALQSGGRWAPAGAVLEHFAFMWLLLSSCRGSRTSFHGQSGEEALIPPKVLLVPCPWATACPLLQLASSWEWTVCV